MRPWLLALAAAALAAAPAAADDPADVVKKAIAAHGGADALDRFFKAGEQHVKGWVILPEAESETDFTGTVTFQRPDKFRMSLDMAVGGKKMAVVQGTNGAKAWATVDGASQKITDAVREEIAQTAVVFEITSLTPLLDAKRFTLTAGKDMDVTGKPAAAVAVTGGGVKDLTLYFDKANGLLVKTTRKALAPASDKPVSEESVATDFKKIEGVMVATTANITHDGKKFMSMTVTEAKVLDKADPKVFTPAE